MPKPPGKVKKPPLQKPLLVIDGECAFCRRWAARLQNWTRRKIAADAYQNAGGRFPEISFDEFESTVRFIELNGSVYSGAAAFFRVLTYAKGLGWTYTVYEHVPGLSSAAEWMYKKVSRYRHKL